MADITQLPLVRQTMSTELAGRSMDASFDAQFPENGSFHPACRQRPFLLVSGVSVRFVQNRTLTEAT